MIDENKLLELLDDKNALQTSRFRGALLARMRLQFIMARFYAPFENLLHLDLPRYSYYLMPLLVVLILPGIIYGRDLYQLGRAYYVRQTVDVARVYQDSQAPGRSSTVNDISGSNQAGDGKEMALTAPVATDAVGLSYPQPDLFENQKNYSRYQTTIRYGEAVSSCAENGRYLGNQMMADGQVTTSETFLSENNEYYSTIVVTDLSGNLVDYSLNTPGERIEYKGGQYAVRFVYADTILPMPFSDKEPLDRPISDIAPSSGEERLFTEDVIINSETIGSEESMEIDTVPAEPMVIDPEFKMPEPIFVHTESEEGVEYYVYELEQDLYCGTEGVEAGVRREWINPQTKELFREQLFKSSANNENLISEMTYKGEQKDADFSEVKALFEFKYDVPVKIIEQSDQTILMNYLSKNNSPVLVPSASWELSSLYSQAAQEEFQNASYIYDRDYYAVGEMGEDAYRSVTTIRDEYSLQMIESPVLESFFQKEDQYSLAVSIYKKDNSPDDLLSYYSLAAEESVSVSIGGLDQRVDVYLQDNSSNRVAAPVDSSGQDGGNDATIMNELRQWEGEGSSSSLGMPAPDFTMIQGEPIEYTFALLYFERGDFVYTIRIEAYQEADYNWYADLSGWEELWSGIDADRVKITEMLKKMYESQGQMMLYGDEGVLR